MKKITKAIKRFFRGFLPYYLAKVFRPKTEKMIYYKYIMQYGDKHHLFLFGHEYKDFDPEVLIDNDCGLPYTYLPKQKKKLYFQRGMKTEKIKGLFKALLMEQDDRSPHRYFDCIEEFKQKTLCDVGAAEGIVSLMAIEYVKHVYLFECDEQWIEALQKTFEPYAEKVTIVKKYVSDHDDDDNTSLDTFIMPIPHQKVFIKMDIEGMERKALNGAHQLFAESGNVDFAICTYHEKDDYQVISTFLDRYRCTYRNQTGYWSHRLKSIMLRGHN